MVLAVYIGGDTACQGRELRARCDGEKPATGQGEADHLIESDAALGVQQSGAGVEGEQVTKRLAADDPPRQGGVAIAAPGASRNRRSLTVTEAGAHALQVSNKVDVGFDPGVAAPAAHGLFHGFSISTTRR